jgi:uncharacterized protein YbjT (DUF2867 family)
MTVAWLAGGSGLVGGALLARLLRDASFERIVAVGRRRLPRDDPRLAQVLAEDFSSLEALAGAERPGVAFCCLGTTMRKAGSRAAFRAVDHDAVVAFARAARDRGARAFLHVTALGADPRSLVFYNAVKGETEADVARLGIASVYAFRPSILDGEREERRPAERVGLVAMRALGPLLGRYRPTPVGAVADAMIAAARAPSLGVHVVDAREMLELRRPR